MPSLLSSVALVQITTGIRQRVTLTSEVVMRVRPGPWVTLQMPTLPVARAQPSVMVRAAPSSRASTFSTPGYFEIAAAQFMLPSPKRPKMVEVPSLIKALAMAS